MVLCMSENLNDFGAYEVIKATNDQIRKIIQDQVETSFQSSFDMDALEYENAFMSLMEDTRFGTESETWSASS